MDGAPLTPTEFSSAVTAITGAFGDPTRREIYLHVRERVDEDTGVTAADAPAGEDKENTSAAVRLEDPSEPTG